MPSSLRDDQETRGYFDEIAVLARERPGCVLLPLGAQIGSTEVNAFRHVSSVVVQKALQRGFALWLSEAMWCGCQVVDGVTGYVIADTETFARRAAQLLRDAELRERLGRNARHHVANHLLITRYLADMLQLYARLMRRYGV